MMCLALPRHVVTLNIGLTALRTIADTFLQAPKQTLSLLLRILILQFVAHSRYHAVDGLDVLDGQTVR